MNGKEIALLLLSIVSGISGLWLAWRNHRMQAKTTIFDDSIQLIEAYREEIARLREDNERLEHRLTIAQKRILEARHETAVCKQRLAEERRLFDQKLDEIERGLRDHLNITSRKEQDHE